MDDMLVAAVCIALLIFVGFCFVLIPLAAVIRSSQISQYEERIREKAEREALQRDGKGS